MKILFIVTSTASYASGLKTGLWLSELTHVYDKAITQGYDLYIASTQGGQVPLDPESLKPLVLDKLTKAYTKDAAFMQLLNKSIPLQAVQDEVFDLVYLAGGHGTMYDFPNDVILQRLIQQHVARDKKIAAICHGVCGLLNVKTVTGDYLIQNKKLTGFNWFEERLAGRRNQVPFNLENELKVRKANYTKALIPMTSKVVVDGNLITGQNPFSSKEMANVLLQELKNSKQQ